MQGRYAWAGVAPQQREMQVVAVEVDDVKARGVLEDEIHQLVAPQGPGQAGTNFAFVSESPGIFPFRLRWPQMLVRYFGCHVPVQLHDENLTVTDLP
jgi:hypothetical protein